MEWLTLFIILVVVVFAIVFATGIFKAKKVDSANAIIKRLVNPTMRTNLPIVANSTPYSSTMQRHIESAFLFLKNVEDTGKIDMNWLNKLKRDTENDAYLKNQFLPQTMAYALALTNLERNEEIEKNLATHLTEHPDPEEKSSRAFENVDSLSTLYARISIHMIWYKYSEKHKLQESLVYDKTTRDKLIAHLETVAWVTKPVSAASGDSKIAAGHYHDSATLESGYVDGVGLAHGGYYIYNLVQAIYFINSLYNYAKLKTAAHIIFERISMNYRDEFVNLAGTQLCSIRLDLRPTWLKSLAYIYAMLGKNFHIGQEYFKQLSRLPTQAHIHSFPYNYPSDEIVMGTAKVLRSVSEGFFQLDFGPNHFQLVANTTLNNYQTTPTYDDEIKSNLPKLRGYLNYGSDYSLVFKNYNASDNNALILAGQYTTAASEPDAERVLTVPSVGALVPLNNDIYYVCHYDNPDAVQAHGFLDIKKGIHEYTVIAKVAVSYCAFSLTSRYYVSTSKINDYTWCVFDFDTVYTIQTDTTLALTLENIILTNDGSYVKIMLDLGENVTAKIVVSRSPDTLKIDNVPEATFGLPSGITLDTNSEANANRLSSFVYSGKTYVISSIVVNNNAMPTNVVNNGVHYPFKNISFGRYIDFVKQ